jgi:hypothetical protein
VFGRFFVAAIAAIGLVEFYLAVSAKPKGNDAIRYFGEISAFSIFSVDKIIKTQYHSLIMILNRNW